MNISVIIPTYKPGNYIWDCLVSLQNQTFPMDSFEVLLVLNGCNEPYFSDLTNYIHDYLIGMNISIFQTNNGGVSNARNIGIDNAKGDFLTFLDDDDKISPNFLFELYNISKSGALSLSNFIAFDDTTNQFLPYYISDVFKKNFNKEIKNIMQVRSYFSSPCAKLIRRDVIGNRRFNTKYSNGEDGLFMLLISDRVKKFAFTSPDAVYFRRIRSDSVSMIDKSKLKIIKTNTLLIKEYFLIWINGITDYNLLFVFSRVVASVLNIIHKK